MKFIYINSSVILAELFYAKVLKAIFFYQADVISLNRT